MHTYAYVYNMHDQILMNSKHFICRICSLRADRVFDVYFYSLVRAWDYMHSICGDQPYAYKYTYVYNLL